MGALYRLIGTRSLIRVQADDRYKSDDYMEYHDVCPEMQIIPPALKGARSPMDQGPVIPSSDCTNCRRCINICDKNLFHFGFRGPDKVHQDR